MRFGGYKDESNLDKHKKIFGPVDPDIRKIMEVGKTGAPMDVD